MKRSLSLLALIGVWVACRPGVAEQGKKDALPPLAGSAPAKAAVSAAPKAVSPTFAAALRREDWKEAAALLDADPDLTRRPELRYARAEAARRLGDDEKTVAMLSGLEGSLPLLADKVRNLRGRAQLEVGPYSEAAAYFEGQGDADAWVDAARAWRKAPDFAKARAALGRAIALLERRKRPGDLLAEAHRLRAGIAEEQGDKAQAILDWRWLALEAPCTSAAADADERLLKLAPAKALSKGEREGRLMTFAEVGMVDAVESEIVKLQGAKGPELGKGKIAFARGFSLYNARRDLSRAADLLETASQSQSPDPAKSSFYAARARARAQDDERALAAYRALARRYPKSSFSENALYLVGKTYLAAARYPEAFSAYDTYLKRFGKNARFGTDAAFARAVSLLATGRYHEASQAFALLGQQTSDARQRARLLELEGVAHAGAGDRDRAVVAFQKTIAEQPLSFAALAAAARLERLGVPVPSLLGPPGNATPLAPLSVDLPEAAETLRSLGLDREAEAVVTAHEREIEARHAPRSNEALCLAYDRLDVAGRRYQVAQGAVTSLALRSPLSPATAWQWQCVYPRPHASVVEGASTRYELSQALLWGVMRQESGFRPDVVSPANAIGLMQLIPSTAERVATELALPYARESLESPAYNVALGSYYLRKLLDAFDGNVALAAAAYNAGPDAVFRWLGRSEELPLDLFVAKIPYDETQGYVERIIGNVARYQYVEGGEAAVQKLALELPHGIKPRSDLY